jgi:hypothetical protein
MLLSAWLLVPVAGASYHFGPGQDRLLLDDAAGLIAQADKHASLADGLSITGDEDGARAEWVLAEEAYEGALAALPTDRIATRRLLRLERAKCRMFVSELPEANKELLLLVDEMTADETAAPEVLREARHAYANSQYYMTWLTRLEGAGREAWEPRIESARQTLKLLLADAEDDELRVIQEDLEASVRLARMELDELQGLPLPSQ